METVLQYLQSIQPLTSSCVERLGEVLKEKKLQRRDVLLRSGQVCSAIYFIEKGLLRCYYHKGEQEVCSWFMSEGHVIISVESFFRQTRSYEAIQALEASTLWYVTWGELQDLYARFPEFNAVGRILTEKYYCLAEQRLYTLRMMRSDERYRYLVSHYGDLVLRVPAKYIASYLGLSEAHLSVIKARR
jgi:CRP-like cAMP-binding protein